MCSPSAGTGSIRGVPDTGPGGARAGTSPAGVATRCHRSRAASWGCSQTSCIVLTRAYATGTSASARVACAPVSSANRPAISAPSCSRWWLRAELVAYSSRVATVASPRNVSQNRCHSRSFWIAIITTTPSPAVNGPYG